MFFVDPHLKTPYTYQYNLSVQRELFNYTVLEVSLEWKLAAGHETGGRFGHTRMRRPVSSLTNAAKR